MRLSSGEPSLLLPSLSPPLLLAIDASDTLDAERSSSPSVSPFSSAPLGDSSKMEALDGKCSMGASCGVAGGDDDTNAFADGFRF